MSQINFVFQKEIGWECILMIFAVFELKQIIFMEFEPISFFRFLGRRTQFQSVQQHVPRRGVRQVDIEARSPRCTARSVSRSLAVAGDYDVGESVPTGAPAPACTTARVQNV